VKITRYPVCDEHDDMLRIVTKLPPSIGALTATFADVDDEGAREVGAALARRGCAAETLWLSHNAITDAGAVAIAVGLSKNTSVRVLNLDWNDIGIAGERALEAAVAARAAPPGTVVQRMSCFCWAYVPLTKT